ncbi:MAG: ATP-binding cassette domain-containing protein [Cytophagales bacterium]|nr:ATP-binding cassette domain-containing protein [Cytophagales bacterium]
MLAFYQFEKSYQGRTILNIPDQQLSPGLYHLKGQNGAGKTTLIKSIAGLIPFKGSIKLMDVPNDLKHQQAYRKLVSFAPAEPVYPGFMKGIDLIRIHQELRNTTPEKDQELIQKLGVDRFQDQHILGYSSGMLKKLSLILAFIGSPKLIILDEPMNALDTEAVQLLEPFIAQYQLAGSSFLITSHQDFHWVQHPYATLSIQNAQLAVA